MQKKQLFTTFPVTSHTDYVTTNSTFVVIKGQQEDGSVYLQKALERGASTLVMEVGTKLSTEVEALIAKHGAHVEYVGNARKALAYLSAEAAGHPAKKLKLFGVGGTKGKTTTVCMLAHLLKTFGKKVAFISTALVSLDTGKDELVEFDCTGTLTTPQPDYVHQFLKLCVEKRVEYVVLEVAAQAHTFFRLEDIEFEGVIFTNLDREHGELYPCMEQYFSEKQKLFAHVKPGGSVLINADDLYGQRLLEANSFGAKSFGVTTTADYDATLLSDTLTEQEALMEYVGTAFICTYRGFPGLYNLSNVMGAVGLLAERGFPIDELAENVITFPAVPGRLEMQQLANGALAVIDYAHTASSFEQVIALMRPRTDHLIVLFGAGGGKDVDKRPVMGEVASRLADVVIVTDDNPRFEDPAVISDQIVSGVKTENKHKVTVVHDRQIALEKVYALSHAGSIIMLLGKGPDDVQIVNGERLFFSEKQILEKLQQ
jgi:UDP-N-acetylmuramoyl-L-alanyl-D-glutamate--2,6-diaminopimelate ligase